MGIHDRDYYRDGSHGFLDGLGRQGLTVWLIAVTSVVFFGQCLTGNPKDSPLVDIGAYQHTRVAAGEVWRLVTPMFLHFGLFHLFCNMLILYWAGSRLEELYGSGEFVTFYLVSGVFAQAFYFLAWVAGIAPANPCFGASGAVTAVFVLYAFHFPRQQVLVFFILPMPIWLVVVIYVGLDALGALGARDAPIAYFVHLGGAAFGAAYYQTGFRFGDLFRKNPRDSRPRAVPRLHVVPAESIDDTPTPVSASVESPARGKQARDGEVGEELERRLDQVLAKVSKHGQESLTTEEREILFKASELYKKRRK